jgi:hypothetical protein
VLRSALRSAFRRPDFGTAVAFSDRDGLQLYPPGYQCTRYQSSADLSPITAFQVNIVGPDGRTPSTTSLSYRSRAPNGLVGVGWSITGLSQISRCAQTTAENGQNAPIAFDSRDRRTAQGMAQESVLAIGSSHWQDCRRTLRLRRCSSAASCHS